MAGTTASRRHPGPKDSCMRATPSGNLGPGNGHEAVAAVPIEHTQRAPHSLRRVHNVDGARRLKRVRGVAAGARVALVHHRRDSTPAVPVDANRRPAPLVVLEPPRRHRHHGLGSAVPPVRSARRGAPAVLPLPEAVERQGRFRRGRGYRRRAVVLPVRLPCFAAVGHVPGVALAGRHAIDVARRVASIRPLRGRGSVGADVRADAGVVVALAVHTRETAAAVVVVVACLSASLQCCNLRDEERSY